MDFTSWVDEVAPFGGGQPVLYPPHTFIHSRGLVEGPGSEIVKPLKWRSQDCRQLSSKWANWSVLEGMTPYRYRGRQMQVSPAPPVGREKEGRYEESGHCLSSTSQEASRGDRYKALGQKSNLVVTEKLVGTV